jgi:hypothetical protein
VIAQTVLQPRFAMTAAMAFFSLALTSNMLGLHAGDLRPSNLQHGFYHAETRAIQFYENLAIVEQLESRVHDFQHMNDENNDQSTPASAPADQQKNSSPSGSGGSSQRELPLKNNLNAHQRNTPSPADRRRDVQQGVQA